MSKDGRDSATLILMKISHFDRTALYVNKAKMTNKEKTYIACAEFSCLV